MRVRKFQSISTLLALLGMASIFSSASTLDIYQDGAKYRMIPTDSYLGFAKNLTATCEGQNLSLTRLGKCAQNERLCKLRKELEGVVSEEAELRYTSAALKQMLSLAKPVQIEADKWIEAASKIGKRKAELASETKLLSRTRQAKEAAFSRQAPSPEALFLRKKCAGELELTLPAGTIGAKLLYEADIGADNKMQIRQYLAIKNRSGIDIVAKDLNIYAKSYRIYLRPQHFSPWTVQISRPKRMLRKSKVARMAYSQDTMVENKIGGDIAPTMAEMGEVVQTGYKNYHVSGVELPSTGEEIKVKIADYQVQGNCDYVSYPYRDTRVYRACSFTPLRAIESDKWRIKKGNRVVSDQAYGEYRHGKYQLNVDVDDTVLVKRKPIVKKDRSSGIFGGSVRKKDGFEVIVSNISDKPKQLKIIERIPTSTTDKIKVKLLKVEGADTYALLKDGKLEISISLAPREEKKVTVWFELRYDKETKVRY